MVIQASQFARQAKIRETAGRPDIKMKSETKTDFRQAADRND